MGTHMSAHVAKLLGPAPSTRAPSVGWLNALQSAARQVAPTTLTMRTAPGIRLQGFENGRSLTFQRDEHEGCMYFVVRDPDEDVNGILYQQGVPGQMRAGFNLAANSGLLPSLLKFAGNDRAAAFAGRLMVLERRIVELRDSLKQSDLWDIEFYKMEAARREAAPHLIARDDQHLRFLVDLETQTTGPVDQFVLAAEALDD